MAKKKNRKKELRRQQKLNIKWLSEDEGDDYGNLTTVPPIIMERRQIPHFDEQHEALVAYAADKGKDLVDISEEDLQHIQHLLLFNKFPFKKATQIYRQAVQTPNNVQRSKLLRQVLDLDPSYFAAKYHLLLTKEISFDTDYFEQVWHFYDEIKQGWRSEGYRDWSYWEARPYLTALNYMVAYLYEEGFLGLAAEVVEFILSKKPKRLAPDFLHLALSLYNELGRFNQIQSLYYHFLPLLPRNKDSLIFHFMLSKLLQGQMVEARSLFEDLIDVNEEAADFFASDHWLDELFDVEEAEMYKPFSRQSLAVTTYYLMDFFERNLIVVSYLGRFARECGGTPTVVDGVADFFSGYNTPLFDGIQFNIYRTLFYEDLRTAKDFQRITEKDLLAIKGVGQATLKKLKDNGVVFKGN
ncbi:hypothetical protein [Streptococcus halotolerans]|uniref:hypothetical protein n=1 Tax=Streptococcus halotolerans TaxID=1814128 RepID=UPI000786892E|nr:hypothetical protein [Streptococcus halotolerans]